MFSVRSLTMRREVGDPVDGVGGERQRDALGLHQRHVLLDQRAARLGQDADELVLAERLELDADRKAALQLRNEIRRLRDVERARGDEQDVIGAHHPVLRVHRRAFDDRQDVALHALAADVGPVRRPRGPAILSISSMKMMPACSTRSTAVARHAVHVDELLLLFLRQVLERLGHLHPPLLRLALEEPRQHVLEVDVHFLDRRAGDDLERGKRLLADVDLDDARVEPAGAELLAEPLARLLLLIAGGRAVFVRRRRTRRRQQQVEQPLLGVLRRLRRALPRAARRAPCRRRARRGRAPSTRRRGRRSRPR